MEFVLDGYMGTPNQRSAKPAGLKYRSPRLRFEPTWDVSKAPELTEGMGGFLGTNLPKAEFFPESLTRGSS